MELTVGKTYVTISGDIAQCIKKEDGDKYIFKQLTASSKIIFETDKFGTRYWKSQSQGNIKCPYDTKYKVEVMTAFIEGKKIEIYRCGEWNTLCECDEWNTTGIDPAWNWLSCYYRVGRKTPLKTKDLDDRVNKNSTMWTIDDKGNRREIIRYDDKTVTFVNMSSSPTTVTYEDFMDGYEFINGDKTYKNF